MTILWVLGGCLSYSRHVRFAQKEPILFHMGENFLWLVEGEHFSLVEGETCVSDPLLEG